ncbi:MAG TPA: hypothetical protein EYO67_00135 [Candidatus Pelagibacter sp.]|jgi:hypothetical protein|nr:hypothetical protein [Candidatus Pelagibacter sp.]
MKISKLLNKNYLSIFIILFILLNSFVAAEDEPVDIWNLEKKLEENKSEIILQDNDISVNSTIQIQTNQSNEFEIVKGNKLNSNNINLAGLYDPAENGLTIDMWFNSDGNEIVSIFKRINKIKLSNDAKEILDIALLTNSYFPKKNISEDKFLNYKTDYLIQNGNLELIKLYLLKNQNNSNNSKLLRYYVEEYLSNSDLENACSIFNEINLLNDDYLTKFKIYCLINENRTEEAQLQFDLMKELDFNDEFFEKKYNFIMGYTSDDEKQISEKNILDFHLSHRTNPQFQYIPSKNTSKIIWRYLSSSNLLENIDEIDLEDIEKLSLIEQATHEGNYSEKELLDLYKRFQFTINQLLSVKDTYKLLPTVQGRALLYQRLLLTKDPEQILDLSSKLKDSFVSENIENAFKKELSKMLGKINVEDIPSNYSTFYTKNLINQNPKKSKIKINNKIIYQSKLLNYFKESYNIKKVEKDTNDLIKSIKKNKNYFVSTKDLMLLESLQSDGVKISKKYLKLFQFNQSDIPTDLQLLINNNEIGLVLLRFVEILGEDEFINLGSDTIYFMVDALNRLNIDSIRNNILLKVLPLKV